LAERRRRKGNQTGGSDDKVYLAILAKVEGLRLVDGKPQSEQIRLLGAAGFSNADIAELVNTTESTVRGSLSKSRRGLSKPRSPKS
jgi:DNA-binding NarL/FixJ family response regulator